MLGNASGFAEVCTLLWLIVFTLLYLAWETLPAILKEVVNLIKSQGLELPSFEEFLLKNTNNMKLSSVQKFAGFLEDKS